MINKKAVALLSGGLDSRLAVKLILDQGIEILGLNFTSPFCTCTKKGCKAEAIKAAEHFGIPLKILKNSDEMLKIVRRPKFGYGKHLNPCLDCRVLMFKRADEYRKEVNASFLITGEVLGQRPMSQRFDALGIIDRELEDQSDLTGRILRPLSAKFFPPTIVEEKGIIDREKLLSFKGRDRNQQFDLAKELGINDYPCPAGGCLLTQEGYSKKLKRFIDLKDDITATDLKLLRLGRHFDIDDYIVIIGRNEHENLKIEELATDKDLLVKVEKIEGPTTLVCGLWTMDHGLITKAASLTASYSKAKDYDKVIVNYWNTESPLKSVEVKPVRQLD